MEKINKKKVLIIDDDENMNTLLTDKLNFSGFDASGVMDGEGGLKKALQIHPDIILLDLMMPKMDGMEVLEKLRSDAWGKNAKVLMLTALEDTTHIAKAMEKQSFRYLVKSQHSLDDVVKQVKEALK